jgi:Fic family protein
VDCNPQEGYIQRGVATARIARFLMNAMLISGGYDWTVVPIEKRKEYMAALEKASVEEDITDFARFLAGLPSIIKSVM